MNEYFNDVLAGRKPDGSPIYVQDLLAALAPAAVAVVIPAQCTELNRHVKYRGGWNNCLSEVARLNRRAIPEGLLRVYLGMDEGDWVEAGHELRALLGKD